MSALKKDTVKVYRAVVNKDPAAIDRFALDEWNREKEREHNASTWRNYSFVAFTAEKLISWAETYVGRIYSDKRNATTQRNQARRATSELIQAWVEEGEITWKRIT